MRGGHETKCVLGRQREEGGRGRIPNQKNDLESLCLHAVSINWSPNCLQSKKTCSSMFGTKNASAKYVLLVGGLSSSLSANVDILPQRPLPQLLHSVSD